MVLTWGADVPGVETMRKRRTLGTKQKSVLADTADGVVGRRCEAVLQGRLFADPALESHPQQRDKRGFKI